jgi:hypothetical protein
MTNSNQPERTGYGVSADIGKEESGNFPRTGRWVYVDESGLEIPAPPSVPKAPQSMGFYASESEIPLPPKAPMPPLAPSVPKAPQSSGVHSSQVEIPLPPKAPMPPLFPGLPSDDANIGLDEDEIARQRRMLKEQERNLREAQKRIREQEKLLKKHHRTDHKQNRDNGHQMHFNFANIFEAVSGLAKAFGSGDFGHCRSVDFSKFDPFPKVYSSENQFENVTNISVSSKTPCRLKTNFSDVESITLRQAVISSTEVPEVSSLVQSTNVGGWLQVFVANSSNDVCVDLEFTIPKRLKTCLKAHFRDAQVSMKGVGFLSVFELDMSAGDCTIDSISMDHLQIKMDVGKLKLSDCFVTDFDGNCNGGSISMESCQGSNWNVRTDISSQTIIKCKVEKSITLKSDIGKIDVDICAPDAAVNLKTDAGKIEGKLLQYKSLEVRTDIGAISLDLYPGIDAIQHLHCDAGKIALMLHQFSGNYNIRSETGSVKITGLGIQTCNNGGGPIGRSATGSIGASGSGYILCEADIGAISVECL